MKNILIVTGGSGGHVVPSTSLFEHLKNNFSVKMVSEYALITSATLKNRNKKK